MTGYLTQPVEPVTLRGMVTERRFIVRTSPAVAGPIKVFIREIVAADHPNTPTVSKSVAWADAQRLAKPAPRAHVAFNRPSKAIFFVALDGSTKCLDAGGAVKPKEENGEAKPATKKTRKPLAQPAPASTPTPAFPWE